jgi:hypothetical protein
MLRFKLIIASSLVVGSIAFAELGTLRATDQPGPQCYRNAECQCVVPIDRDVCNCVNQ